MFAVGVVVASVVVVVLALARSLPRCLSWLLGRALGADAKIGSVSVFPVALRNVNISNGHLALVIDTVGLSSCFVNAAYSKPVVLYVNDVRVQKDLGVVPAPDESPPPRRQPPPRFLLTVCQIASVHVSNVNVMLLKMLDECLVQCLVAELRVDGVARNSRINVAVSELTFRILHHVNERNGEAQPCLADVHFSATVSLDFDAPGVISSPKEVAVDVGPQLEVTLNEGFLKLLAGHRSRTETRQRVDGPQDLGRWLPQATKFSVRDANVKLQLAMGKKSLLHLLMNKMEVQWRASAPSLPLPDQLDLCAALEGLRFRCAGRDVLLVNSADVKLKHLDDTSDASVVVSSFHFLYIHEEVLCLLHELEATSASSKKEATSDRSFGAWLCRTSLTLDVFDCSVALHFGAVVSSSFKHLLVSVHDVHLGGGAQLLSKSSCDVSLESLWYHIGEHKLSTNPNKKVHHWNSPLFVGVLLLKVRRHLVGFKLESMVDCLNLEWSPAVVENLWQCCAILPFQSATSSSEGGRPKALGLLTETQTTLTNVNVFLRSSKNLGLFVRLDEGVVTTQGGSLSVLLSKISLGGFVPSGPYFQCPKASETKNCIASVPAATAKIAGRSCVATVACGHENALFVWTARDHATAHSIAVDVAAANDRLRRLLGWQGTADHHSTASVTVSVEGTLQATLRLSHEYSVVLSSKDASGKCDGGQVMLTLPELRVQAGADDIVVVRDVEVTSCSHCAELSSQRKMADRLHTKENRAVTVAISSLKFYFPHQYNFALMFSDKLLTTWKWLKALHGMTPSGHRLPPDLWIKFKEVSVELADDLFEFRLHNNHELLEDEYNESLKRWKMMEAKVEEFRKTRLHLPADKVENLYASLLKKNADIYVKRSQQMYSSIKTSNLLTWRCDRGEIFVLADPSLHGDDNVLAHLRSFDPDSPWPEDLSFSTLWCRWISLSFRSTSVHLRDYTTPLMSCKGFHCWGAVVGAEQLASRRARYQSRVELGDPWDDAVVERGMTPLKFYYDLSSDVERMSTAYGPCWEPAMAQYNLSADLVFKPSADPSLPLPVWDKVRLLLHGRFTMTVQQLSLAMHASLDPYNTAEMLEFAWTDATFDWTNGRFIFKGNLDVLVHTASKYDDCRFLHLPNLKLVIKLDWQCLCDPNDHHAVVPCAPDKLPDYSSNQKHDSYRAFRSLSVNVSLSVETKGVADDASSMLFYGNTLRWLEQLKVILSGVACPIRRGSLFRNSKPRKIPISRHMRNVRVSLSLHQCHVCYWMSVAKLRGFSVRAKKLVLSSDHCLSLVPVNDGLKHRPLPVWSVVYMNSELQDGEVWLQNSDDATEMDASCTLPVERNYFLSLSRLSYGREDAVEDLHNTFMHRLVIHDLRGSWTNNNRTVVFGLFDSYSRSTLMRHNLSTEALRCARMEVPFLSPLKSRSASNVETTRSPVAAARSSPVGHAISMLRKLISEADSSSVVFSEDLSGTARDQVLFGIAACQTDDVFYRNWLVELINSQVLLKGCETPGYVIVSASRARILQTVHHPVWKELALVSKTTWVGSFECMQYYATVDPNPSGDNVQWLTQANIEERDNSVISDLADLVGSGQGVGGVVGNTVGGGNAGSGVQLQRIVSRCSCQFFYVSYGDSVDPGSLTEIPPPPSEDSDIWSRETHVVDSFTLMHHDLKCSTNSLQYAMLLDIVNNLLLYVEPGKKEAIERLQRLRFQLQLSSVEDQRKPILVLQNNLRLLISNLRWLEREMHKATAAAGSTQQMAALGLQLDDTKLQINSQAEELAMMISCFKETQVSRSSNVGSAKDKPVPWRRRSEVCFKHAQWRLTENDGLLGIADIELSNFLYSKATKTDDSCEHLLELGYVNVINCMPNQIYKDVLQPTELRGNIPIERRCAIRIFCRDKAAVGGIAIKEHFEVNVVPMTLRVTHQFFKTMMNFCFPERDSDGGVYSPSDDVDSVAVSSAKPSRKKVQQQRRTSSVKGQDDIDKMKERAEKNKMFLYIKIPEVPIRVSYKGEKDKNIQDVQDFNFVLPTLEYHNVTWTWLDFLLAMKMDSKKALLSQAIKHKLQIKSSKASADSDADYSTPHEDDKVRLLMGNFAGSSGK